MTTLSLQCTTKDSSIQFRLESDLKFVWDRYLKENNINQSALFRKWIIEYLKKRGAVRVVDKCTVKYNSVEEMPASMPSKKYLELEI